MSHRNLNVTATAFLALAFAAPQAARAADPVAPAYTLSPNPAPSDKSFKLTLEGVSTCSSSYSRESVQVSGNRIDLSFEIDAQPSAGPVPQGTAPSDLACIYDPATANPVFDVSALKAGSYEVWATQVLACQFSRPACLIASTAKSAGTLVVKSGATKDGWFLKDNVVAPNKAFSSQILNNKYGSCQTSFSHQSVSLQNGEVWFTFLITTDSSRVCITNTTPFGPSFDMDAMAPGKYPVRVSELLPCQVTMPFCPIARILPPVSDTLIVSATSVVLVSGAATASPSASFVGGRLDLALPAGQSGAWRAQLMTPSGRVLAAYRIEAREGGSARFDAGARTERGVYLVRFLSPSGETRTLPVLRKD